MSAMSTSERSGAPGHPSGIGISWNCFSARRRRWSIHSGSSLSSEMTRTVSSVRPFSVSKADFSSFLNSKRASVSVSLRWSWSELMYQVLSRGVKKFLGKLEVLFCLYRILFFKPKIFLCLRNVGWYGEDRQLHPGIAPATGSRGLSQLLSEWHRGPATRLLCATLYK